VPWDIAADTVETVMISSAVGRPLRPLVIIARQKYIRINTALRPIDHESCAGCKATNCAVSVNYRR